MGLKYCAWIITASSFLFAAIPAYAKIGSCTDPIVLGTTISESGAFSTLTDNWTKMTQEFAKEINNSGGVEVKSCGKKLPLKFVIYDDQSNPSTAVSLYERMATVDKVDFFVGPDWSSIGNPVAAIAEKHKIPMVAGNVATPSIYQHGYKYLFGTPYPEVPLWSERYFDMISHMTPKPKSIYFITQDNPVMKAVTDTWSKKAEAQGLKVISNVVFPPGLMDFTGILARVRAAKPDIIYISSFDGASVPLVQQMRQLGIHAMDVHHTMLTGSLYRQVGKDIEGMTGELPWYPGVKGDYSDLVESVLKNSKVNMFDDIFTFARVASYLVMVQAIEKAGVVDREAVRKALYKGTFKSPAGDIVFAANGFPESNGAFTLQIQNGKPVVVWPKDRATGKVIWPSPTWQ